MNDYTIHWTITTKRQDNPNWKSMWLWDADGISTDGQVIKLGSPVMTIDSRGKTRYIYESSGAAYEKALIHLEEVTKRMRQVHDKPPTNRYEVTL
jgi:hypothetical protein